MKNSIFLILISCLIFTVGCRKDAMLDVKSNTEIEETRKKVTGNHDLHMEYVKNFNRGNVKPRSTYYEIGESVELMNHGLNELYCRPGQKLFDSTLTYFDTLSVPVNGSNEIHEDENFHECLTVDEMNFHYQEMRDLLIEEQPGETDVIVNIEVGYWSINIGFLQLTHMMQGWYADKIAVAIGNEEPEDLPEN